MTRDLPRESRLFAGEILQGAPRMGPHLETRLQSLFDEKCTVIQAWMDAGDLAHVDPRHLVFSIWATTQHYADFEAQVSLLLRNEPRSHDQAVLYLRTLFTRLLRP
jgi:TetR/AcrR family transcriptional regulator